MTEKQRAIGGLWEQPMGWLDSLRQYLPRDPGISTLVRSVAKPISDVRRLSSQLTVLPLRPAYRVIHYSTGPSDAPTISTYPPIHIPPLSKMKTSAPHKAACHVLDRPMFNKGRLENIQSEFRIT